MRKKLGFRVSGFGFRERPIQKPELLDRLWVRLVVAGWIIAVVLIYYRLQIGRLVEVLK